MIKKVYAVSDMHCPNCAMRVEGIEDGLPGVVSVEASYKKGQMTVVFDEAQVTDAQIIAAVKAKGYTALLAEAKQRQMSGDTRLGRRSEHR